MDLISKFHESMVLVPNPLKLSQYLFLVFGYLKFGSYDIGICLLWGIDIAVISSWYYLRSLAGRYWYKVGITSSPYWASKAGIAFG
jgi:hypothetical protein